MDSIYDILRRYEFNKTEPETLQELVKKAIEKGNIAQQEIKNLARASRHIAAIAEEVGLVLARPTVEMETSIPPMVGIDGSCQQMGGFGGKWYLPISCAIVKALHGSLTQMDVEVVANIEEIQQREFQNVGADASRLMMTVETKAIATWAQRAPHNSFVFIDGPIIDPPSEKDSSYVNLRSAAMKACLSKKVTVIGCVKRSFDLAFRDHAMSIFQTQSASLVSLLSQFPSDTHLLTFILSVLSQKISSDSYLHTKPIPLSENEVNRLYREYGIRVYCVYIQKDIGTSLLSVEIVVPEEIDEKNTCSFTEPILDLCVGCTYPGHYVPLTVQMAHEKCNIRQGCAEVLYDEIMTRTTSSEPLEQIVLSKLR